MREFHMVSSTVWPKMKRFPDVAKLAFIYLWTSRHQTSAGACFLPVHYAASDLGWPNRKISDALSLLSDGGAIHRDFNRDEVFICDWYSVNAPRNANHYKGILREAGMLQSNEIKETLVASLRAEMMKREWPRWMDEVKVHLFPDHDELTSDDLI